MHRLNTVFVLGLAAIALVAGGLPALRTPRSVEAHGTLDQRLANNNNCDPFEYPASVTQAGGQAQEFVPSQPGLAAVELCLRAESGPTNVTVRILSGSDVLGGATIVADLQAWTHVDFAAPIVVTPGETYVIELATDAGLEVSWFGNPYDIEHYPDGESNATSTVRDFAFRTFTEALPATASATPSKTATPTKTRTPTATATSSSTPSPTQTATTIAATETSTPVPAATESAATTASTPGRAAASPTRAAAVLGGARRTGTIRLPDVGGRKRAHSAHALPIAIILAGAGAAMLAASRLRRFR